MKIKLDQTIASLRKKHGLTLEDLAGALDQDIETLSAWESGASLPDATSLLQISEYFGVATDMLLTGQPGEAVPPQILDDGRLRIVQYLGTRLLDACEWTRGENIQIDAGQLPQGTPVEVWGNLDISEGDITGPVSAGGNVVCGEVGGSANAGGNISCRDIGKNANAGGNLTCAAIHGKAFAGGEIRCDTAQEITL